MDDPGVWGLKHFPTRRPMILTNYWVTTLLISSFVGLRLWARLRMRRGWRNLWWDDYLLILGVVASWMTTIFTTLACHLGYGRNGIYILPATDTKIKYYMTITMASLVLKTGFAKASIALLIFRAAKNVRWMRWSTCLVLASMVPLDIYGTAYCFIRCKPMSKQWDWRQPGVCWDLRDFVSWATAVWGYSAAVDIFLASLPCFLVRQLQMRKQERWALGICMSAGALAGIASLITAVMFSKLPEGDRSWDAAWMHVWISIDQTIAYCIAALPILRPVFRDMLNSRRTQRESTLPVTLTNCPFTPRFESYSQQQRTLTSRTTVPGPKVSQTADAADPPPSNAAHDCEEARHKPKDESRENLVLENNFACELKGKTEVDTAVHECSHPDSDQCNNMV